MPLNAEHILTATDGVKDAPAVATTPTLAVITFAWGTEMYGVPLVDVCEVARLGSITPFPGLPATLLGAVNLRGEVLPVTDVRGFLNLEPSPPTHRSRLIVVPHHAERVGLLVDSIGDVLDVPVPDRPTTVPELVTGQTVLPDGRLLSVLDVPRALATLVEQLSPPPPRAAQ
jgi:purine-binding chemotaxis protein CheW